MLDKAPIFDYIGSPSESRLRAATRDFLWSLGCPPLSVLAAPRIPHVPGDDHTNRATMAAIALE